MKPCVVFTDLDGSLLDHDSYSFAAAAQALALLALRNIPWILNSSKTAAEMSVLRQQLNNRYPYIVENGAAVIYPENAPDGLRECRWGRVKQLARCREDFLPRLHQWRAEEGVRFRGFADMSAPELCDETGLTQNEAEAALQREYSEPIVWQGDDASWQRFERRLTAEGLRAQRGGRFIHISDHCDKGQAMLWLAPRLVEGCQAPRTIALGDGGNDVPMLALADEAVLIRSHANAPPPVPAPRGRLQLTDAVGPEGWNSAVLALLDDNARNGTENA
ncbi:HAD-IIB family hydrolase [Spongiibacter marinus]|uniref:HAD-IIB family hydrolase n=1 Tax=Spongiibacter marinus TaxID=354246 RepID=UPI00195F53C2|nr:mannosyl-3-phosphoglycerate phosphatase family protein [Spongiibacter marinus]